MIVFIFKLNPKHKQSAFYHFVYLHTIFDTEVFTEACRENKSNPNIADNHPNRKAEKRVADEFVYFDEELYRNRYLIERTNAWLDGFKGLLTRYEKKIKSWTAWHFRAFVTCLLRKPNIC